MFLSLPGEHNGRILHLPSGFKNLDSTTMPPGLRLALPHLHDHRLSGGRLALLRFSPCDHLLAFQLAMSTTFPSKLGSLLAFVLIEIALGIYFPSIGTLRRYCSLLRVMPKPNRGIILSPVCEMVPFQHLPSWLTPINDHQPISSEFHHYQHNDDHHYNHQYLPQHNNIHRPRPNL